MHSLRPDTGSVRRTDEVTKVHAICVKCGALAYVSHRLVHDQNQVLIGEQAEYEPLCRECYKKAMEQ